MWWGNTLKPSFFLAFFKICTFKIEWTYHNIFYFLSLKYLLKKIIFQDFSAIEYKDKNNYYYSFKTKLGGHYGVRFKS
jgi:hypothetical protein